MSSRSLLMQEIKDLPEPVLGQLLDFARFLKAKGNHGASETAIASESALAKDWLKPAEDQAWQDL